MKYEYERIKKNNNLPAKIVYFNEEVLEKWRSHGMDDSIPLHWHRSIEITLVMHGKLEVSIVGEKSIIEKNNFIFVNSGLLHSIKIQNSDDSFECLVVVLSYEFMKDLFSEIANYSFDLTKNSTQVERLKAIFQELKQQSIQQEEFGHIKIKALLVEIVYLLMTYFSTPLQENHQHKKLLNSKQFVLDYIEEHYVENVTLESISNEFHMSPEHFSRSFKKIFGIGFKEYVMNYRTFQSHKDIVNTTSTIQQIALKHGFPNVKSYIREFQKVYQLTPHQYRISKKDNF